MNTIASICAVLGVSVASLLAQDDARLVKFRLLCYEHARDTFKALVVGPEGGKQEVEFFTGGFSPQIVGKFTGGKVRFFTEKTGPDGKLVTTIVAEGNLNPSAEQLFLLVPEAREKSAAYKILTFDDLEASFPMGATRVINLASFPIRLNLAGTDMPPVKPGGVQIYPQVKVVDEWNMYPARIDFGLVAAQWVAVATQSWKASERKRDWVITHVDPATHEPIVRLYQDIPPGREDKLPVGKGGGGKPR